MIGANYITEWAAEHPWRANEQFSAESTIPPVSPIKIKIETNCKEHFTELGYREVPFTVENGWFSGSCLIKTFALDELLGTKVRALFQRKKGRDLFDLHYALTHSEVNCESVMRCFERYMMFSTGAVPSLKQFDENMAVKLTMPEFCEDTANYLRQGVSFNPKKGWMFVRERLWGRI